MSLLCRAKFSLRIRLSSVYSIASLQQLNSYSTSRAQNRTSSNVTQKSPASSNNFSARIKKPTDVIIWPKPSEVPYQEKVANFVNLIGFVKAPIQFETASDGKHSAATVISEENSGGEESSSIPVVFEGDLANVVACHVKVNDRVLVSGKLCFVLGYGFVKFHVVVESLNFVKGSKSSVSEVSGDGGIGNVDVDELDDAKDKIFSSNVSLESNVGSKGAISRFDESKSGKSGGSGVKKKEVDRIMGLWRDLVKNSLLWLDYRDHKVKGLVKETFPDFKHKGTDDALWVDKAPKWVLQGLGKLEFDAPNTKSNLVQVTSEFDAHSHATMPKLVQGKEFDALGTKQKLGQGSDKLENDALVSKPKVVQRGNRSGKDDDFWKDLVDNPKKWWDNRTNKKNPRAPDFKNKETGKGLWVNSTPDWLLSRLPPLK